MKSILKVDFDIIFASFHFFGKEQKFKKWI